MALDITSFMEQQLETAVVEICNPNSGEPLGVKITLASPDSGKYRTASLAIQNRQLQYSMKNRGRSISAERLEENALELLIEATLDWEGLVEDGRELACTPENVRRVYQNMPFIREQVDEFLGDRRNFFRN